MRQRFSRTVRNQAAVFIIFLLFSIGLTFMYLRYMRSDQTPALQSTVNHMLNFNVDDTLNFTYMRSDQTPALQSTVNHMLDFNVDHTLNFTARMDVQTRASWGAPIMWTAMFDPELYDETHLLLNSSVALTVFAVGKYLDAYLETFLSSAEKHFMLGLPVTYYVFTDLPERVPNITLGPHRSLKILTVQKHSRWQDVSMMRMKTISVAIAKEIRHTSRYVFCFDVDQIFVERFGSEALGDSVALLQAWFYKLPKQEFTYERNPKSKAYMGMEAGDFYYHAAIFGGLWENVKHLVDACYLHIMEDKVNNVEAVWHDESHLNKYFWLHKPSKILSPEYCWDMDIADRKDIKVLRLVWGKKQYGKLRTK